VCISRALDVGVDVEALREIPDAVALAQRYFSPSEAAFVSGGGETEQAARFLACWTRKEAVVKGVGAGLLMPLDGFSVPLSRAVGSVSLAAERWIVAGFPLGDAYVGAVAARLPPMAVVCPDAPDASGDARLAHCRRVDLAAVLREMPRACITAPQRPS
jgi:4'-phosphopantetheinyl transferase